MIIDNGASGAIEFTPRGAAAVNPVLDSDGVSVTYPNVWANVDLRYTVTNAGVTESLLLKSAAAASSFGFQARTGSLAQVLGSGSAVNAAPAFSAAANGRLVPVGALSGALSILPAAVVDNHGAELDGTGAVTAVAPGLVTLGVDSGWLSSQPASSFPINLDPTISEGQQTAYAYKSDGYSCTNCGIEVGNSRGGGLDTYWRSVTSFDLSALNGKQILSDALEATLSTGTANAYTVNMYHASANSYAGADSGTILATGQPGAAGTLSDNGGNLTSYLQSVADTSGNYGSFGFTGQESPGAYTYQYYSMTMFVTYNTKPSPAVIAAGSPGNGSSPHQLAYNFYASSTDADGDALQYYFRVAENSDAETNVVYNSGWLTTNHTSWTAGTSLWNKKLYWHVYVKDPYWQTNPTTIYSFTPTNHSPAAAKQSGSAPGEGATVASPTPTLSVPKGTDPDGDTVYYDFTVSGSDTGAGKASSGWQAGTSWTVPTGVLEDGHAYQWSVATADGPATSTAGPWSQTDPTWASTITINQRLGASGPAPTDSVAGVTVGMANGNLSVGVQTHAMTTVGGALSVGFTYNSQASQTSGLLGQYYLDKDRQWNYSTAGAPVLVRVDPTLDMRWNQAKYPAAPPGLPKTQYLVKWTGYLTLPAGDPSGSYQFGVESDDGARIYWNNNTATPIYNDWTYHPAPTTPNWSSTVSLTAGQSVPIEVDYFNQGYAGQLSLFVKGTDSTTSAAVSSRIVPTGWMSPTLSALPAGWTLSLPGPAGTYTHASIGDGVVVLTDGDGAAHTYRETSAGGYLPPEGEDGVLTVTDAHTVTLHDDDGTLYTFDAQGNPLTVTGVADTLHPAAATYTYDASVTPARVSTITDPVSGRSIDLYYGNDSHCTRPSGYDQSVAANLLCGISYWDGTTTGLYYSNGALSTLAEPGDSYSEFGYAGGLLTSLKSPTTVDWQAADPADRDSAPVTTDIAYTWVAPATSGSTNVRPAYTPVSAPYPVGSVPLVTSVTAPSPDGGSSTPRPQHTFTYVGTNETQEHTAGLTTAVDRDVTYDTSGRTLTTTTATGQKITTAWDKGGQDLPVSATDATGRETTTIYDWANRATDTYGPAPSACFQANGLPVATPPATCGTIQHSHTGYDTSTTGIRMPGLEASVWSNTTQSGAPAQRLTADPDTASWSTSQSASLSTAGRSAQYTGEVALAPGTYSLKASVGDTVNDGVRVYLGGSPSIDRWTTLNQAVLGDGPAGFWRLNDAAGSTSAADEVSGGTSGAATSVTFGSAAPGSVDTSTSGAFNGTSSKVSIPNGSAVPNGTGALSIEVWVKLASSVGTGTDMIVTKDTANGATNDPYELRYDGGHIQFLQADGSTFHTLTSAATPTLGAWHQLAVTKTPTGIVHLYMDGQLDANSSTFPTTIPANTRPVLIGARDDATRYFDGNIANVSLYGYALSDLQVAAHYSASTATLASSSNITFTALSTPVVTGTLPAAPASTPQAIRVDYRNPASAAHLTITATNTSSGAVTTLTGAVLDPRFGLATYTAKDDAGGLASGVETTATSYSGSGLDPVYGLATDMILDPGGSGHLNLDTKTGYEAPGSTGYLRKTSRALPSATLGNTAQQHSVTYYGNTETRDIPCPGGATGVNQAGLPDITTEQTPATGPAVASEAVYDAAGRIAASRNVNDGNVWSCTTYDAAGRISQVSVPAVNGAPARTITYQYAVGGNPLVTSVTDNQGTITTTVDLLGRVVSYTDTTGTTTTTTYNQAGQGIQEVLQAPGGGTATVATTYLDDGRVNTVALDGSTVAVVSYDSNAVLSGVTYPTGTGDSGNGTSLGSIVHDAAGRETAASWSLPGSHTYTDTLTLSQAGRTMNDTSSLDGTTQAAWTYGYDTAGRLITANLAAAGSRPAVSYGYGYSSTGGCGTDPAAGLDSARTSQTVTIGSRTPSTSTSCTDYASRLTSITGAGAVPANQIVYDDHGNLTRLGGQTVTYDASDRATGIAVTNADGSTQTIQNSLDSDGRVVTRTATGTGTHAENDSTIYAYGGSSDAPTAQLTASHTLGEDYLTLPGGALLVRHYNNPGADVWAYPDLHGHIILTAGPTGALAGSGYLYDPYGQPLDTATGATDPTAAPRTRTNGPTDAWHGQSQRGYENTNGENAILMGARVYLPSIGQFASTDPTLGGNANPYTYPTDPVNGADLTGRCGRLGLNCSTWISIGIGVVVTVTVVSGIVDGGASEALVPEELAEGASLEAGATGFTDAAAGQAVEEATQAAEETTGSEVSSATRVFWSGRGTESVAETWARQNGGTTLGMTQAGRATEEATEGLHWNQAGPMWADASADFAKGARGVAHVFVKEGGPDATSVWQTIEYPKLVENGVDIIYHVVGDAEGIR